MVYITHVRFDGEGTGPEHIIMLRWRQAMGDTNVNDMIKWIESGGVAKVNDEPVQVVRQPGKPPYLFAQSISELPRF
ncbi:MAG TPA: hypothetical protein VIV11_28675 [Kofleriaceae bacterium]